MELRIKDWVNEFGDDLFRWALHKTGNRESAEDLVQETFLAAVKGLHAFKGDSQPRTWLFSILNNKISDYHRARYRQPESLMSSLKSSMEEGADPEQFFDQDGHWKPDVFAESNMDTHLLDRADFREALEKCFAALPDLWASTLQLKYLSNKKGKEICQELGLSTTNYWQIMHRAKLQLRACLEKNYMQKEDGR